MQLRSRLTAIASAVALAASLAVAFAGPAAAADDQFLCATTPDGQLCAVNVSPVQLGVVGSRWNVPPSSGQISVYTGSPGTLCMQYDQSDNNLIVIASCAGRPGEEWEAISHGKGDEYKNVTYDVCLNAKYPTMQVNAATCNGGEDETWFS